MKPSQKALAFGFSSQKRKQPSKSLWVFRPNQANGKKKTQKNSLEKNPEINGERTKHMKNQNTEERSKIRWKRSHACDEGLIAKRFFSDTILIQREKDRDESHFLIFMNGKLLQCVGYITNQSG